MVAMAAASAGNIALGLKVCKVFTLVSFPEGPEECGLGRRWRAMVTEVSTFFDGP